MVKIKALEAGDRVWLSGDAAELWIKDYNVRISSGATVRETPMPCDKKVMVTIDSIDHDNAVTTLVKKSCLQPLYQVRYEDNEGCNDGVEEYRTEEEAEAEIEKELEAAKKEFGDYDYGDFWTDDGLATEIWVSGEGRYARWIRLWRNEE